MEFDSMFCKDKKHSNTSVATQFRVHRHPNARAMQRLKDRLPTILDTLEAIGRVRMIGHGAWGPV
jgi:hypothetical protein